MSELTIKNNLLQYRGTTYNLRHAASFNVFEVNYKKPLTFKILKYLAPIGFILVASSYIVIMSRSLLGINLITYHDYALGLGIIGGIILIFAVYKTIKMIKNRVFSHYGLVLSMVDQEKPIFISSNKSLLFKIQDGIEKAMTNQSDSIKFDNVNIEIKDSSKVEIGNIVKR